MSRLRKTMVRFLLAGGLLLAPSALTQAALGLCAQPLGLAEAVASADIVLVGTVTDLTNEGRWVRVEVARS